MKSVPDRNMAAEGWLDNEDRACRSDRLDRLRWIARIAPRSDIWTFPGSDLSLYLFEEARYCFVYGQFLATVVLGMAYIERTLAAWFYAAGRDDLERASFIRLLSEARDQGWLRDQEYADLERIRQLRNPLAHFRAWGRPETIQRRALEAGASAYELIERDAREVLAAVMSMLSRNTA